MLSFPGWQTLGGGVFSGTMKNFSTKCRKKFAPPLTSTLPQRRRDEKRDIIYSNLFYSNLLYISILIDVCWRDSEIEEISLMPVQCSVQQRGRMGECLVSSSLGERGFGEARLARAIFTARWLPRTPAVSLLRFARALPGRGRGSWPGLRPANRSWGSPRGFVGAGWRLRFRRFRRFVEKKIIIRP